MEKKIVFENVSKSFKEQQVLKNINIEIHVGECIGVVGGNGSGKTVFLKLITGLMYSQEGNVIVNGKTLGKDIDFPENIGAIIETPGFIPYKSGFHNLLYLASLRKKIGKEDIRMSFSKVGLDPHSKKHVSKYSLGMKQRLGIAQAIMENPDLLILDEPMNGLDKDAIKEIRELLLEMKKQGVTIVLASHIQSDIDLLCDRVYEIYAGELSEL